MDEIINTARSSKTITIERPGEIQKHKESQSTNNKDESINMAMKMARDLVFGRWKSQILHCGVKLGIFESLVREEARSSSEIAHELNLDVRHTYRLMRALSCIGLLEEDGARCFRLTTMGSVFRQDHPMSLRGVTLLEEGPTHCAIWKHFPDMIKDGQQDGFTREFGHSLFEHFPADPSYTEIFGEAMTSYSKSSCEQALEVLEKDPDSWIKSIKSITDVGGSNGYLLCNILKNYDNIESGAVLELPSVVGEHTVPPLAKQLLPETDTRSTMIAGNMFENVPGPTDAIIMKHIVHDWSDEESVVILKRCLDAVPVGGRVLLAEFVVPEANVPHFSKLLDIHMMCVATGRERTEAEYEELLVKSGWTYLKTMYPAQGVIGVVVGVKE